MDRVLAYLFLYAAGTAALLGNFWFTYGIWPQSWGAFATFACIQIALLSLHIGLRDK